MIFPERVTEYPDVFVVSDDMPELMQKLDASTELQHIAEVDEEIFEEPNVVLSIPFEHMPRHEGQWIRRVEAESPATDMQLRAPDGVHADHFIRRVGWRDLATLAAEGRTT